MKILVIVPCYNEQASLPKLLSDLDSLELSEKYKLTVAIVNDCSVDKTKEIAERSSATLINLPVNLGIGGAVQSGLKFALKNNFDLAVQIDGDGQHPPKELAKLLACYESTGANLVIGSRFIEREGFQSSYMRRTGITYFRHLNKILTGKKIYDSTSGFRLFDRNAIRLCAGYYPDDYPEPESLIVLSKAGLSVKETSVVMSERNGGQSSIRHFSSVFYCLKVTLAMLFSAVRKPNFVC